MVPALKKAIFTVRELLQSEGLTVPVYQRPYKWTGRHVHQLFQDILQHKHQNTYRLGTLVFHQDAKQQQVLNIVDGQQRTLTLVLAVYAIIEVRRDDLTRRDLQNQLDDLEIPLLHFMQSQKFDSDISQYNLHQNHMEIKRLVARSEFTEDLIDFLRL